MTYGDEKPRYTHGEQSALKLNRLAHNQREAVRAYRLATANRYGLFAIVGTLAFLVSVGVAFAGVGIGALLVGIAVFIGLLIFATATMPPLEMPPRPDPIRSSIKGLSAQRWQSILQRWSLRCAYCGSNVLGDPTLFEKEHIVPLSRGGPNTAANIAPACSPCNAEKYTKTGHEYVAARRRANLPTHPDWDRLKPKAGIRNSKSGRRSKPGASPTSAKKESTKLRPTATRSSKPNSIRISEKEIDRIVIKYGYTREKARSFLERRAAKERGRSSK